MEHVQGVDLGKMAELGSAYVSSGNVQVTGGMEMLGMPSGSGAGADGAAGLPESLKIHLARQMVEVVDFIHQKGVLHRDLKPENFMADYTGRIKLLDLGMARLHNQGLSQTDTKGGALKGTLAYLPPEILRGQGRLETVSEYYSLALVLLEIFSGARYYRGKSADEVVSLIQSGISITEIAGVPSSVKALLSPYLKPDPMARPKSLEPLLKGLKGMQSNSLALAGGREALEAVIRKEQKAWLWAMVRASEGTGKIEDAFARLRELLEADPENAEVQTKFQELGERMNFAQETSPSPPADGAPPLRRRAGRPEGAFANARLRFTAIAAMAAFSAITGAFFYFEGRQDFNDLGRDLVEREMNLLSKENDAGGKAVPAGARRPALRPYGVLIVTGMPKDYRVVVNRVRYPAGGEIHLPASRHLIVVEDGGRRPVLRDSVAVGGGEPTVYDFSRRAGKP
jgi:hypothetical protein